jgi:ATP-dependent helicase HrpA
LWGRVAAAIEPEWVEPLAGHLVTRAYSEPHWDRARGAAVGYEKVTLYGLPIVARRPVTFGRIDPRLARELFIRHALVEGDWDAEHRFLTDNRALLRRAEELEHRARRRDIVAGDEVLFEFFDQRLGEEVVSAAHFDRWWKRVRRERPDLLTLTMDVLVGKDADRVSEADFPDAWTLRDPAGAITLPLTYRFEPGTGTDGVTVDIPLPLLDRVTGGGFDWQVPGLRRDLVIALIRSLPKAVRRAFVPVPEVADAALAQLPPYGRPLPDALAELLRQLGGVAVAPDDFNPGRVPDHLRMNFRVLDPDGRTLAEGRDLAALRAQLRPAAAADLSAAAAGLERRGLRAWTIGSLPRRVTLDRAGHPVTAYPALVDAGDHVDVRVFTGEAEQAGHMARGTRRLLLLGCPSPASYVSGRLAAAAKLVLLRNPHGGVRALLEDCATCAVDALVTEHGGPAWDETGFAALRQRVRGQLDRATLGVVTEVLPVLKLAGEVESQLSGPASAILAPALADLREQLGELIRPGFVAGVGWQRLPDLLRYLRAMARRLERLPANPDRDRKAMAEVHQVRAEFDALPGPPEQIRWMIEELRVSLFAQQLGTPYPVSATRIYRAIDAYRTA